MRSWDTFVIHVVNRHKDKSIEAEISNTSGNFSGKPSANEISAADLTEPFVFDKQQHYVPTRSCSANSFSF
jgi:hypothetical protein